MRQQQLQLPAVTPWQWMIDVVGGMSVIFLNECFDLIVLKTFTWKCYTNATSFG